MVSRQILPLLNAVDRVDYGSFRAAGPFSHEPASVFSVFGCRWLNFIVLQYDSADNSTNLQVPSFSMIERH
jgi:hypothetical protein